MDTREANGYIAEIQSVTSKLYAGANEPGPDDEADLIRDHDEL